MLYIIVIYSKEAIYTCSKRSKNYYHADRSNVEIYTLYVNSRACAAIDHYPIAASRPPMIIMTIYMPKL